MTPMENASELRLLAVGKGKSDNMGLVSLEMVSWPDLVKMSSEPIDADIEHAAFMALSKVERNRLKKKAPFVTFGEFLDGKRRKESVTSRSAAQIDIDEDALELFARLEEAELTGGIVPFAYVGHTTRSHTDEHPRLRLMVPFSRDVAPSDYPDCVRALQHLIGATTIDSGSLQAERLMYLPVVNRNAPFWCWKNPTGYVDPDYLLEVAACLPDDTASPADARTDLDIALAETPRTFYQKVNALAMKAFGSWVPNLFPEAIPYKQGGYRIPSSSLGRALEEDISIVPEGIKDFGVADMGDARAGKRSPIDLVLEWHEAKDAAQAANWICEQLGVDPSAMGGKSTKPTETDLAFRFHSGDDYAQDFNAAPELVEDVFPERGIAMVYGPSGKGKTFWTLDLAFHVHNGAKWRDKDVVQGDVMYVAAEAGRGIKKRIQAVKRIHPEWRAPFVADLAPDLASATSLEAVRDAANAAGHPAIVIIDTMSASFEGDDSSQADVAKMIRNLKILSDALECLVLFVHHTTKDGASYRGSGVLFANVDAVLELVSEGEGAERRQWMTQRKHREGEDGKSYPFALRISEPLATKPNGKPVTSCTVEQIEHDGTLTRKEKRSTGGKFETSENYATARHFLSVIQEEVGLGDANIDENDVIAAIQRDEKENKSGFDDHPPVSNIKRTLLTLAKLGKIRKEGRWIRVC